MCRLLHLSASMYICERSERVGGEGVGGDGVFDNGVPAQQRRQCTLPGPVMLLLDL